MITNMDKEDSINTKEAQGRADEFKRMSVGMLEGNYKGLPYEGPHLNMKKDDPDYKKPQLKATAFARVFKLNDPKHLKEYELVLNKMAEGTAMKSLEEINYESSLSNYIILLRWLEFKYVGPKEK